MKRREVVRKLPILTSFRKNQECILGIVFGLVLVSSLPFISFYEKGVPLLPVLRNVSEESLRGKAVLFTSPEHKGLPAEKTLSSIAKEHGVDIVKVNLSETSKGFVYEQGKLLASLDIPFIESVNRFLLESPTDEVEDVEAYFSRLSSLIESAVQRAREGLPFESELSEAVAMSGETAENMYKYIRQQEILSKRMLETPISEKDLPLLVFFSEEEEKRISVLTKDPEVLSWMLVSQGILSRSPKNALEEVALWREEGRDFVVVFGSTSCFFSQSTAPIVERVAKEKNILYRHVDLSSRVNAKFYEFLASQGTPFSGIEGTPTIKVFRGGQEVSSLVGMVSRTAIEDLITKALPLSR